MELTIEQVLQQGITAHTEGKLQEAERLYSIILQSQPAHPEANHNLGVIAVSVNKADAALPLFKAALEANPKVEQFWLSYIDALIKENQFETAKNVLAEGKKIGLVGLEVDALEAQLKPITQSALPKSPEKKKSLTLKEKRKKIAESKQQKKQVKSKNANSLSPSQSQLDNLLEHYQNGRYDEAEKLAVSITEQFPKYQFGWKVLGAVLGQAGRKSEAVNAIQTAVTLSPQDAEAHGNLGVTLQELGRLDESEASLRKATALKPGYAEAHSNLGNTLKEMGRLDDAQASYTQAIALKPDFVEAHSNLGNTLKELGRLDEAEASYIQAIGLKSGDAQAYNNLGATLQELGRLEGAEANCRQAIALKPDLAEAHYNLGSTLQKLGRLDEAKASYTQAILLKQDYAEAHSNLGSTLQELGRLDEAEVSYRQAIVLKPDYALAHNNLGVALRELGKLDEAEASYLQAIVFAPDYAEAYSNLGGMLKALGRLDEAKVSYTQAIALKPDFAEAHSNLGATLLDLGRLDEAEASFIRAIGLKPDFAQAHSNLGATLQELGRSEEAEASCTQAIGLKPDYAEAHYNLGIIFFETKRYDKALQEFELTDVALSKSYSIRCSYLQDKASIFYEKLDSLINHGESNAIIGSLTGCSEIRYGIKRSNPFCNQPLQYVLKTDLHEQYDFEEIFVKTVKDVLADTSTSNRAQGLLTNGIQTSGNIFVDKKVSETEIESIIHAEVEKYRVHFKDSDEGFIRNWPTSYKIKGWLVSMQSGGQLAAHIHELGWISGSVYIHVPVKSKPNSGNLVVRLDDQEHVLKTQDSQESMIDVETGSICLFPASLYHYTVPFEDKEDRIVLAFDVISTA